MRKTIQTILLGGAIVIGGTAFSQTFTENISTPFQGREDATLLFVDLDGDGDEDVIESGWDDFFDPRTTTYLNDGNGNFSYTWKPFTNIAAGTINSFDADGDSDLDIFITGRDFNGDGVADLFINDGIGNFTLDFASSFSGVKESAVVIFDYDGDGNEDILVSGENNSYTEETTLYENNGAGLFTTVIGTPFDNVRAGALAASDIDNDNDIDVLLTGYDGTMKTELFINNGNSTFTKDVTNTIVDLINSDIEFSDVDGDGFEDFLICGRDLNYTHVTSLYMNDGFGGFSVSTTAIIDSIWGAIKFADMDGDNDDDILIVGSDNNFSRVAKLYTNNAGVFTEVTTTSFTGMHGCDVDVSDVDGDNDLDILYNGVVNYYESRLYINGPVCSAMSSTDVQSACGSYIWIDGNTYTANNTTATDTIDVNGCDSIVTLNLTINNQVDNSTITTGFVITSNQTGAAYQWIDCSNNSIITGATDSAYTATINGDYAVVVTVGVCSDTSACVNISTVGIDNAELRIQNVELYPNPTSSNVTIDLGDVKNASVSIVTVTGKTVYSRSTINENQLEVSLTDFSKGIYFVKIQSNNQQKVIKLIKQ